MNPIHPFIESTEFPTSEQCYIVEMLNHPGEHGCSIARARVPPGVTTELHALRGITERYIMLDGEGVVEIGDGPPTRVNRLDVVHIPPDVPQRITNTGSGDLTFLCVCIPGFRREAYISLGPARSKA